MTFLILHENFPSEISILLRGLRISKLLSLMDVYEFSQFVVDMLQKISAIEVENISIKNINKRGLCYLIFYQRLIAA